ncbi:MAG: porin [Pseudomonadota bacterium]
MKTKLLAGVIATCFAAPVLAQSSVQIYGIADAGIMKTQGEKAKIVSGIADGSRLGFKGTEDIGGGWKAIFNLEARIELDTGTQTPALINNNDGAYLLKGMDAFNTVPGLMPKLRDGFRTNGLAAVNSEKALFDRTAMVGLITPVGAVLLGRMYTPGYEVFAAADAFESGTAGTWGGITGGTAGFTSLGADIRSQKSIQYRIAKNGFGGSLMYGFKGSGYVGRYNKFQGMALTYKANGFDIGVAHNRGYDQNDNKSLTTTTIGGSYTMGEKFKFFAGYHDQKNEHSVLLKDYIGNWDDKVAPNLAGLGAPLATALRNIFVNNMTKNTQIDASSLQLGMHYRIGSGRIMASVARQNDRSASNSDATLVAIGYDYNLSKRTDVYTVLANIANQNDGQYTPGAAGSPGGFGKVVGEDTRAIQVGIRHRF